VIKRTIKTITCGALALTLGLFSVAGLAASEMFRAECYVSFSPKGGATHEIIQRINDAKKEILVSAYSFTSYPIAAALVKARERKVKIILIADSRQTNARGNRLALVKNAGIQVYLDDKHSIAHNKVIIIDNQWVHTGSFNFSAAAEVRNAENSLWCRSVKDDMAEIYRHDFFDHLNHSIPY